MPPYNARMSQEHPGDATQLVCASPFLRRGPRPDPQCRLVCFPYAGAGASLYRDWPRLLPGAIEVVAVQLPGREDRAAESPATEMGPLVRRLAQVLRPYATLPMALLGHSGGAVLAFEVARQLAARGGPLAHLFVAAEPAPHLPLRPAIHALPDAGLLSAVRTIGGTPPEVLASPRLMEALLPMLRADFALFERHRCAPGPLLTCPVTALGGDGDHRTSADELRAWGGHTTGPFRLRLFPGGHFFLRSAALGDVTATVAEALLTMPSGAARG
jgi:medium-chain acyl-[acyl-carrier-protein] hydrolase